MTTSRRIELFCGCLVALLGLIIPFAKHGSHTFELDRAFPGFILGYVLLFGLPGLLFMIGAYLHAVKQKTAGLVIVILIGLFLTVLGVIFFFGGGFYVFGLRQGTLVFTQAGLAAVTAILSLFFLKSPEPQSS